MNKWKVNLKIWQVKIKIWQDDIKIWQVNIIIWQVMADICHHRSLLKCITLDFDIHVFALILHFSHPCQTVFSTCCISLSLPVRSTTSSAYTIIIHRYPYSSFDLLIIKMKKSVGERLSPCRTPFVQMNQYVWKLLNGRLNSVLD